jgi:hypothetical protein
MSELERGLHEEESLERERDRTYWKPLKRNLKSFGVKPSVNRGAP